MQSLGISINDVFLAMHLKMRIPGVEIIIKVIQKKIIIIITSKLYILGYFFFFFIKYWCIF